MSLRTVRLARQTSGRLTTKGPLGFPVLQVGPAAEGRAERGADGRGGCAPAALEEEKKKEEDARSAGEYGPVGAG
jgi:hypothetical protein